jgi:Fe-Mn family superoxide dismutase
MNNAKTYSLPKLNYGYNALAPFISEQQLTIHHQKHHQAYVNGANAIFDKLDKARKENSDVDMKATLKELSFHIAGHTLHSIFWQNLAPGGKAGKMSKKFSDAINAEFGSFERFKKEFSQAAASVEGSGWAALAWDSELKKPVIMQIEKHNNNVYPDYCILMVLDVWEHAYYLDYKNERAKFIEAFWKIVNWDFVSKSFEAAVKA